MWVLQRADAESCCHWRVRLRIAGCRRLSKRVLVRKNLLSEVAVEQGSVARRFAYCRSVLLRDAAEHGVTLRLC